MVDKNTQDEAVLVKRYTLQYLLAMGLVSAAILLGAFHISQVLKVNRLQGEVIRTAAAQHTLAQRLVLLPDRIAAETNVYKQSRALAAVREAIDQMRAGHDFLMNGSAGIAPPALASPLLKNLYGIGGLRLGRNVSRFLEAFERYWESPDTTIQAITLERVNAESFLFVSLARAAELHTQASEEKMASAINLHKVWISIALALVALVILFVFRPLARNAAKSVATMSAELDEGAELLSRSLKIAKMGHWRAVNAAADPLWLSNELLELLEINLEEGFHPRSTILDDQKIAELNDQQMTFQHTWKTGEQTAMRSRFKKPSGETIDILIHMEAELDNAGEVVGVVGVTKDHTAETQADRALKESYEVVERKSNDLIEAQRLGKLGTWRRPFDTQRVEWDESTHEIMGLDPATFDASLKNVQNCYVDDGVERISALNRKVIETGEQQSVSVRARRGDGALIDLLIRSKLEQDESGKPVAVFGTVQDISKEQTAARELEKLAYFDDLTGLANRTLFSRELSRVSGAAVHGNLQAALLLIDLDHFKEVNDTLGHQAGDQLLGIVAHRLARIIPELGFVARLGGDEFAVLVENYESTAALDELCSNIIEGICVPATLTLGNVQTNASIGVALAPLHSCEPDELLSFADLALYSSKDQGRGRASYYDSSYSKALGTRISLSTEIRAALDEKRFEAHYQPIVGVGTSRVDGFEALLRLPKSGGGFIPPSEFIPIAESSRLIADLGSFILHKACTDAQSWVDAGLPKRSVSVNVSAAQIRHGDLEKVIDSALNTSGLDPHLLCIELTESVFAADSVERLDGIFRRLKERGIQLALDDFGTGYSSLGYLNRFPFDILKIDRMFVSNAHSNAEKQKMLRVVVSLAKGLDLKVTAEGVETKDELHLIEKLGCDAVQGWIYGKALPSGEAVVEASRMDALKTLAALGEGEMETTDRKDTSTPQVCVSKPRGTLHKAS
ncbi:MAG: EAL domain-containing protein [Hyphomicrobiales bacterium]